MYSFRFSWFLHTIVAIVVVVASDDAKYCKLYECGSAHIACRNDGSFGIVCPKVVSVENLSDLQELILHMHNEKRNEIATGLAPLLPATRMAQMIWDEELAELALLQVKSCLRQRDRCRPTKRFRYAGQNVVLETLSTRESEKSSRDLIAKYINGWMAEFKNTTMSFIRHFRIEPSESVIGHFTIMIVDRNSHIGCAAMRHTDGETKRFSFTCNYASTNIIGRYIYAPGPTGQNCTTGMSARYPSLCSTKEMYDNAKV